MIFTGEMKTTKESEWNARNENHNIREKEFFQ